MIEGLSLELLPDRISGRQPVCHGLFSPLAGSASAEEAPTFLLGCGLTPKLSFVCRAPESQEPWEPRFCSLLTRGIREGQMLL